MERIFHIAGAGVPQLTVIRPLGYDRADPAAAILFLHGGGWTLGALETYEPFLRGLANATDAVVIDDCGRFKIPELDAAIDDAVAAPDEAGQKEAYGRVQAILGTLPMVMLTRPENAIMWQGDKVHDLTFFNDNVPHWDTVWVDS